MFSHLTDKPQVVQLEALCISGTHCGEYLAMIKASRFDDLRWATGLTFTDQEAMQVLVKNFHLLRLQDTMRTHLHDTPLSDNMEEP